MFWLSRKRTFGLFVTNCHEQREVHAKKMAQLPPKRLPIFFLQSIAMKQYEEIVERSSRLTG